MRHRKLHFHRDPEWSGSDARPGRAGARFRNADLPTRTTLSTLYILPTVRSVYSAASVLPGTCRGGRREDRGFTSVQLPTPDSAVPDEAPRTTAALLAQMPIRRLALHSQPVQLYNCMRALRPSARANSRAACSTNVQCLLVHLGIRPLAALYASHTSSQ